MRNPDRLDSFYEELKNLHKTYLPDWRFGQLISNFSRWVENIFASDLFFYEEDWVMEKFKEFLVELGVKNA